MTYKFEMIASVITDVLHDVSVGHPYRDHGKPTVLEGIRNPDKIEDIGM